MSHETLYRKVQRGKRTTYQVAYSSENWDTPDLMRPGTLRIVYAHDISQAAIDAVRNFKP